MVQVSANPPIDDSLSLMDLVPTGITLVIVVVALLALRFALGKTQPSPSKSFLLHVVMLLATFAGLLVLFLVFAQAIDLGRDAMQVIGAILVGVVGLSSTTILGNALAGLQLRAVAAFKSGDYLRVSEHFGRVTERGLFHTEIQTEYSDLTTFPNLYLVNNPYRVVQKKGTIITATVSLGYDIPRPDIDACLKEAASNAGLADPFVQVVELGDFAVNYRVGGMYENVKHILTCRSNLRRNIMDSLFSFGIEIASPTLMDTRAKKPDEKIIPPEAMTVEQVDDQPMEAVAFQKADEIESVEEVRLRLEVIAKELTEAKAALKAADDAGRPRVEAGIAALEREQQSIQAALTELEDEIQRKDG